MIISNDSQAPRPNFMWLIYLIIIVIPVLWLGLKSSMFWSGSGFPKIENGIQSF